LIFTGTNSHVANAVDGANKNVLGYRGQMAGTVAHLLRPAGNIGVHPVARRPIRFEWLAVKNLRITELEPGPGGKAKNAAEKGNGTIFPL
jgi:hypothetical protein